MENTSDKRFVAGRVREILDNTPEDYLFKTAELHLNSYEFVNTPEDLIYRLWMENDWREYSHPAIMEGCQGFIAPIPGKSLVVSIDYVPHNTEVVFSDPKGTGFAMGEVRMNPFVLAHDTVLIAGEHEGKSICYTFHAGDPIAPSKLPAKEWAGRKMTVRELLRDCPEVKYVRLLGPREE